MKNSGVEWIGEIPDDWDCIRFKYIFSILGGCGFKEEYQGQGMGNFPFCKASDINGSDKYVSNANNYVNKDVRRDDLGDRGHPDEVRPKDAGHAHLTTDRKSVV